MATTVRPLQPPLLLAVACAVLAAGGGASARVLAISYFDNHTGDDTYDALGRGLAEMMITDLSAVGGVTVVERARLNDLLDELDLARSPFVDPATAAQMGRGLGAEWILTGSFVTADPQMRIDARLVDVASARVVDARSVTGPREEFFLLQKELAAALVQVLDVEPTARDTARMGRVRTESFGAIVAWSQGIEAMDRGELEEARTALEASLALDDRFDLAREALERLRERMERLGDRRVDLKAREDAVFLARLEALAADPSGRDALAAELGAFATHRTPYADATVVIEVTGRVLDLGLPDDMTLRTGAFDGLGINAWAVASYAQGCYWLGRWTEFLTYAEQALERYPTSPANAAITAVMGPVLNQMEQEAAGREREPMARLVAHGVAAAYRCDLERGLEERIAACRDRAETMARTEEPWDERWIRDWATAAVRAGDDGELERVRAFVETHGLPARGMELVDEAAADLEKRRRAAETYGARYDADDPPSVAQLARRLHRAGQVDRSLDTLARGLARWPGELHLLRAELDIRADVGDVEGAAEVAAAIRAAPDVDDDLNADVDRALERLEENARGLEEMPAYEMMQVTSALSRLGLHRDAAALFIQMSREHPGFRTIAGPLALQRAAMEYMVVRDAAGLRAAYEEIIERFPDSAEARQARAQLQTIPR